MQINNFTEYINEVKRTINSNLDDNSLKENFKQSLFEEIGEIFGIDKKITWHGHHFEENKEKLIKEIGDAYWYLTALSILYKKESYLTDKLYYESSIAVLKRELASEVADFFVSNTQNIFDICRILNSMCVHYKTDIKTVLTANSDKLRARYKEKFTIEESINRKD